MPTSARPPGQPGTELSAACLAHELKTPLAAIDAAGESLLAQATRLLGAIARVGDAEVLGRLLPWLSTGLSEPAASPPTGMELPRRIAALESRLREGGAAGESASRIARAMVQAGWERHVDSIAPCLGGPESAGVGELVEAAARIRSSLRSLSLSSARLEGLARSLREEGSPRPGAGATAPSGAASCVEAAFELVRHRIPSGVDVQVAGNAARGLLADPVGVQQVLTNLIVNALDAVPQEGGRIRVSCADLDDDVAIRVEDNGPGVPPALRGRLFTPYATGRSAGTGLGLYVARLTAERMGGSLTLDEGGGGAAFLLRVPAARPGDGAS